MRTTTKPPTARKEQPSARKEQPSARKEQPSASRLKTLLWMLLLALLWAACMLAVLNILAPNASAQVVTDTYTDAAGTLLTAHTSDSGSTYAAQSGVTGTMQVTASGTLRPSNGTNAVFSPSGAPATTNYDVQADILYKSAVSGTYYIGISSHAATATRTEYLFRWDNAQNDYDFYDFGTSGAVVASSIGVAAPASAPFTPTSGGVRMGIRTQVSGANLLVKCYVAPLGQDAFTGAGSALVYTYTDATGGLPTGLAQVQASEPSANAVDTGGFQFDNLSVVNGSPVPPPVVVAVTDPNWYFSPYNWYSPGTGAASANNINAGSTYALSNNPGAYSKVGFTGTTAALGIDTSALNALSATIYPVIAYSVDNGPLTYAQVTAGQTSVNFTPVALGAGSHTLRAWFDFVNSNSRPDRWTTPAEVVKVTGLSLDNGAATVPLAGADASQAASCLVYWDSIGESQWNTGDATGDTLLSFTGGVAEALGCNLGNVSFGSEAWTTGATSNVPAFTSSWNFYYNGQSRLVGGLLLPAPAYILCGIGTNDFLRGTAAASVSAASQGWYASARAAAPTSKIVQFVPFGGFEAAPLLAAFQAYQGGSVTTLTTPCGGTIYRGSLDPNCYLINLGQAAAQGFGTAVGNPTRTAIDGIHPTIYWHSRLASLMAQAIDQATSKSKPVRRIN